MLQVDPKKLAALIARENNVKPLQSDAMMDDEPYQARTLICSMTPNAEGTIPVDAWGTSYGEAKSILIKIIESIPDEEEIEICGI